MAATMTATRSETLEQRAREATERYRNALECAELASRHIADPSGLLSVPEVQQRLHADLIRAWDEWNALARAAE